MGNSKTVAVIGGGSWATALVKLLCNNLEKVNWWVRNPQTVEHINKFHHNPNYLTDVEFDISKINVSSDLSAIIEPSDILIVAIPSAFVYDTFASYPKENFKKKILFSAIKGIIPESNTIPARYFHKTFRIPYDNIGIICGPCHAEEVALERLSYLTLACMEEENAITLSNYLACRYMKTNTSEDLFGTEISAVLKNIYAIASGICSGLGYGDNFQAVLIANAIRELEHFCDNINPFHRDVKDSAYLGDLLVTAYSKFSRNRTFGQMLGSGYSVKAAQLEMKMIAEGYYAVKGIHELNEKFKIDMPIAEAVYNIIYEKISPAIEIKLLSDKLT
jgi:glycerol-3-phosphate dehydrogenase (NAD(P)+)